MMTTGWCAVIALREHQCCFSIHMDARQQTHSEVISTNHVLYLAFKAADMWPALSVHVWKNVLGWGRNISKAHWLKSINCETTGHSQSESVMGDACEVVWDISTKRRRKHVMVCPFGQHVFFFFSRTKKNILGYNKGKLDSIFGSKLYICSYLFLRFKLMPNVMGKNKTHGARSHYTKWKWLYHTDSTTDYWKLWLMHIWYGYQFSEMLLKYYIILIKIFSSLS